MQSAKKQEATEGELQLKRMGDNKFREAQQLVGGRDFLEAIAETDTSARLAEKIRTNQAIELGNVDLKDSARPQYVDARVAANSGVAALATSEDDRFNANKAVLDADLGLSSTVSNSTRALAQSETQLARQRLINAANNRAGNVEILGSIAGAAAGAYNFKSTDPLANRIQAAPDLGTAVDSRLTYGHKDQFDKYMTDPYLRNA